jgi:hypothetical protein
MNDRIKKKKRKQKETILNLLSFSRGIYEWGTKTSSSIKELSVTIEKFRDCAGRVELYY